MKNFITDSPQNYERLIKSVKHYSALGYDTVPLLPGTKRAFCYDWQRLDPQSMWGNAPQNANIGIRAGGKSRVAILDFDDKDQPGTTERGLRWLSGLGLQPGDYPLVQTASGIGHHAYISLLGEMDGNYKLLTKELGVGEFRYGPGSYVGAPPSRVGDNGYYRLIDGDFCNIPIIELEDILPIIGSTVNSNSEIITPMDFFIPNSPRNLEEIRISRNTQKLLNGQGLAKYQSRSEAEQAILTGLCNSNPAITYEQVKILFDINPCAGKYHELKSKSPKMADRWLQHSFENARKFVCRESPVRIKIRQMISWAQEHNWRGRTGLTDKAIYLTHLHVAHKVGKMEYSASIRQIADIAGKSRDVACNATRRLLGSYLEITKLSVADKAHCYRLIVPKFFHLPTKEERDSVRILAQIN